MPGAGAVRQIIRNATQKLPRDTAPFEWRRRMGEYMAHHTSTVNKALHWLLVPLQLAGLLRLLAAVDMGEHSGVRVDLARVYIALTAPVYLMAGGTMGLWFVAMEACLLDHEDPPLPMAAAAVIFATLVQLLLGHGCFENRPRGGFDKVARVLRDATRGGLFDPVPVVLIPFYHTVDLTFRLGRESDRDAVEQYTRREIGRLKGEK